MAKYLVTATYSPEGIKGVMKAGGTARSNAVAEAIKGGGRHDGELLLRVW